MLLVRGGANPTSRYGGAWRRISPSCAGKFLPGRHTEQGIRPPTGTPPWYFPVSIRIQRISRGQ
jgi:hypothetical protein